MTDHLFLEPEHQMLRDQLRRYIDDRIKPAAEAWETDGMVPRDVLREMGTLGFLGVRYPETFGGTAMDTRATAVLPAFQRTGKVQSSRFALKQGQVMQGLEAYLLSIPDPPVLGD